MKFPILKTVWHTERSQNKTVKPHTHNFYELVYYVQGHGETSVAGKSALFQSGNFIIIPPKVPHSEKHFEASSIICLGFESEQFFLPQLYFDRTKEVYEILSKLILESTAQGYGHKELMTAYTAALLILIQRNEHAGNPGSKDFYYMINYIAENHFEKIKLPDCAKQLNISYDYFRHKFKKITGLSPQEFLIEKRLQAAKEALKNGMNCTETAYCCGFSTSAQFSMLFKNKFGVSPKRFKNGS